MSYREHVLFTPLLPPGVMQSCSHSKDVLELVKQSHRWVPTKQSADPGYLCERTVPDRGKNNSNWSPLVNLDGFCKNWTSFTSSKPSTPGSHFTDPAFSIFIKVPVKETNYIESRSIAWYSNIMNANVYATYVSAMTCILP